MCYIQNIPNKRCNLALFQHVHSTSGNITSPQKTQAHKACWRHSSSCSSHSAFFWSPPHMYCANLHSGKKKASDSSFTVITLNTLIMMQTKFLANFGSMSLVIVNKETIMHNAAWWIYWYCHKTTRLEEPLITRLISRHLHWWGALHWSLWLNMCM